MHSACTKIGLLCYNENFIMDDIEHERLEYRVQQRAVLFS